MISSASIPSSIVLRIVDESKLGQVRSIGSEAQHARAIESFYKSVGSLSTPKELVADFPSYSFIMRAFDLEDQIFGKAMIRKILESDANKQSSLLNRLTDVRFKDLYDAIGPITDAEGNTSFFLGPDFTDQIVEKYLERIFINRQMEQNEQVGVVLDMREKFSSIENWFDVLKEPKVGQFFRTALGVPNEIVRLSVEKQKAIFEKKFNISNIKDLGQQDQLIREYLVRADMEQASIKNDLSNILTLFQPMNYESVWNYSFVTLNIPRVNYSASSLYR